MRKERTAVDNIIRIEPLIYGLCDEIEKEQENVIADMVSPAEKVIERLIALDNRRIDLCNLKVLYGFMERGLGESFGLLCASAFSGTDCGLYNIAYRQLEAAGYTAERIEMEFAYLFKLLKKRKRVAVAGVRPVPLPIAAD